MERSSLVPEISPLRASLCPFTARGRQHPPWPDRLGAPLCRGLVCAVSVDLSAIGKLSDARLPPVGDRFEWSDMPRLVATDVTGRLRFAPSPGGPLRRRRERYCHLRRRHLRLAGAVQMAINRDYSVIEDDEPPPKRPPTTMSRPARLRPGGRHLRPRRGQPGREPAPPCRLRGQRQRQRVQDHARDREPLRFDVLVCRLAPSRV